MHWRVLIHWGHQIRHLSIVKGKISRHFSYPKNVPSRASTTKGHMKHVWDKNELFVFGKGIQSHPFILVHSWWKKLFNYVHLLLELPTPQVLPYMVFYIICYVTKGLEALLYMFFYIFCYVTKGLEALPNMFFYMFCYMTKGLGALPNMFFYIFCYVTKGLEALPYMFFYIFCYVTKGLAHVADLIRLCCQVLCLIYYFIFLLFMCLFH